MKWIVGLVMPLALWLGLVWAPPAGGLGELSRIIVFHIPVAWVATLAFLIGGVSSLLFLITHDLGHDDRALAAHEFGVVASILAWATGALFAKATWGGYWNWDPREFSMVTLILIYLAYLALRNAIPHPQKRARVSGAYSLLALLTVPFLVFLIPRWARSLHPQPIVNQGGGLMMDPAILTSFLVALGGFTLLFLWVLHLTQRVNRLQRATCLPQGGEVLVERRKSRV